MLVRSRWLGWSGLACAAVVAAVFSTVAFSQNSPAPATSPAASSSVSSAAPAPAAVPPFTTTVSSDFTKLKPAPNSPTSIEDLRAIQARVEEVVKHALPATVAITIETRVDVPGPMGVRPDFQIEQGSGVLVSKDGYILTAGHVSGKPGTQMRVTLSNGQAVAATALGANTQQDSGMIKIDTKNFPADYPFVPLGESSPLVAGEWVVALGHPGGYDANRPPVVRIGRVLSTPSSTHGDHSRGNTPFIRTDCELIMGDSGGPLFDLNGRLVGINSRIGMEVDANIHVPIDTVTQDWSRLADSQLWAGNSRNPFATLHPNPAAIPQAAAHASLGAQAAEDLKILQVFAGSAAEKAGLHSEDIITAIDGRPVKSLNELAALMAKLAPGKSIKIQILRNNKPAEVSVTLQAADNQ